MLTPQRKNKECEQDLSTIFNQAGKRKFSTTSTLGMWAKHTIFCSFEWLFQKFTATHMPAGLEITTCRDKVQCKEGEAHKVI